MKGASDSWDGSLFKGLLAFDRRGRDGALYSRDLPELWL